LNAQETKVNCTSSPSGEHQYIPSNYTRDDSGFWLDCVHCGHAQFFDCYTEHELFELFDGYADDED